MLAAGDGSGTLFLEAKGGHLYEAAGAGRCRVRRAKRRQWRAVLGLWRRWRLVQPTVVKTLHSDSHMQGEEPHIQTTDSGATGGRRMRPRTVGILDLRVRNGHNADPALASTPHLHHVLQARQTATPTTATAAEAVPGRLLIWETMPTSLTLRAEWASSLSTMRPPPSRCAARSLHLDVQRTN